MFNNCPRQNGNFENLKHTSRSSSRASSVHLSSLLYVFILHRHFSSFFISSLLLPFNLLFLFSNLLLQRFICKWGFFFKKKKFRVYCWGCHSLAPKVHLVSEVSFLKLIRHVWMFDLVQVNNLCTVYTPYFMLGVWSFY